MLSPMQRLAIQAAASKLSTRSNNQSFDVGLKNFIRKYEGAAQGRRMEGWVTHGTSANAEIRGSLYNLRNRSRDLVRNNGHAKRAVRAIARNIVGRGIRPSFAATDSDTTALSQLWQNWASESTEADFKCQLTYYGLQLLVAKSMVESGEVFVVRRFVTDGVLPFRLQVLESDFLATDHFQTNLENGNIIKQGIELDADGCPVAYHFYKDHPGENDVFDSRRGGSPTQIVRIPASEVCHIFSVDRPGQLRGVPWLAPVMVRLKDYDDYSDAHLMRQKIAACFSLFIRDIEPPGEPHALTEQEREDLGEKMEPGLQEILPPGKTIELANPPGVEGTYRDYANVTLHEISSGLDISYEILTQDYSEVNFSSARMGRTESDQFFDECRWHIMNPMLNMRVNRWFMEGALFLGVSVPGVKTTWTPPAKVVVDPTKEIPAKIAAIRAGLHTLQDSIREAGKDPQRHLEEIKETNETLDSLDLKLDSDPRNVDGRGLLQMPEEGDEEERPSSRSLSSVKV